MGLNVIPTRDDGQTVNKDWFNIFKEIMAQSMVPRNTDGEPADAAGTLGTPTYPWEKLYFGQAEDELELGANGEGNVIIQRQGSIITTIGGYGITRESLEQRIAESEFSSGSASGSSPTPVTGLTATLNTRQPRATSLGVMLSGGSVEVEDCDRGEISLYQNDSPLSTYPIPVGAWPLSLFWVTRSDLAQDANVFDIRLSVVNGAGSPSIAVSGSKLTVWEISR